MRQNEQPPVEGVEPPKKLAKIVNPLMKTLLRSPLRRLASRHNLLQPYAPPCSNTPCFYTSGLVIKSPRSVEC